MASPEAIDLYETRKPMTAPTDPAGISRREVLSLLASAPAAVAVAAAGVAPPVAQAADLPIAEKPRLLQGPMLGAVGHDYALVWMRGANDGELRVAFSTDPRFRSPMMSAPERVAADNEHVAVCRLEGLQPGTLYYYRVLVQGDEDPYLRQRDGEEQSFTTAPVPGQRANFRLCFGSCARYAVDPVQTVWNVVEDYRPDLFCWLGDNVYVDTANPQAFSDEYRRQREVAALQPLLRRVPQLATWDDNDYGPNNGDRTSVSKAVSLEKFKRYWANPSYGLDDMPGVFFRHRHGAVDLYFLDVRYHRSPNADADGPGKTMLGDAQLAWLKRELAASDATFKLILSGSGWSKQKGPGGDAWSSFLHERDALLDHLRDQRIEGVVLLSGDTHVGELNCIPRSRAGGYDFYELVASPLAQGPGKSWLEDQPEARIRQVCFDTPLFGVIDFDFDAEDPRLRFNVVTALGQLAWEWFEIPASALRNGVLSWRQSMDPVSARRHANLEQQRPYYAE